MIFSQVFISFMLVLAIICYEHYSITDEMRILSLAFTQNQDYLLASQKLNQDFTESLPIPIQTVSLPLLLLRREREGYKVVDRAYGDKAATTMPLSEISISKQTNRFCMNWNDSYVRVYSLENGFIRQLQKIKSNNYSYPYISEDGSWIIVNKLYKWNNQTKMYEDGPDLNITVSRSLTGVTHDLKTIILPFHSNTTYTFNGEKYDLGRLELVGFNNSMSYDSIAISDPQSDGTRYVIFNSYTSIVFSVLNGSTLTYVQTVDAFEVGYSMLFYLTRNGNFLAIGFTQYRKQILVYKYSVSSKKYQFHARHSGFKNNLTAVIISEDGKTVVGAAKVWPRLQNTEQLVFYIDCGIHKCQRCNLDGKTCQKCEQTHINKGNSCVCKQPTREVDGRCVDCLIGHCLLCSKPNECQQCGNGYSLIQGVCLCPSYKNISSINGNCVRCEIEECIKCDLDNVCSKFSDGLSGNHISYSLDRKQEHTTDAQRQAAKDNISIIKDSTQYAKKIQIKQTDQLTKTSTNDTFTVTVTRGEEIEALIIAVLLLIMICMCKRCRHMRVKLKMKEELNEQIPEKKIETGIDITSKRDSELKSMEEP